MSVSFAPLSMRIVRGMTWSEAITLKNDDGTAVDLTNALNIVMRVRSAIGTTEACIELSIANGRITVTNAPFGQLLLTVAANDTRDSFPSNNNRKAVYVYDATIIRPGTPLIREPAAAGKVRVYPQVSRIWEAVGDGVLGGTASISFTASLVH